MVFTKRNNPNMHRSSSTQDKYVLAREQIL